MKNAFVFFKSPEEIIDGSYLEKAVKYLTDGGFPLNRVEIVSSADDLGFKNSLSAMKDTFDNVIVCGGEKAEFSYKSVVSETLGTMLIENENAKRFVDAIVKEQNTEYKEEYALLPLTATIIPNLSGVIQGFTLEESEFTLISLPSEPRQFFQMLNSHAILYLENKHGINRKKQILKYFGKEERLNDVLDRAKQICDTFKAVIEEEYGDFKITLIFDGDESKRSEVIRFIVGELKDGIYAESDEKLSKRLFDLLMLRKLKIAVAESFTGGKVVSSLIENSGASSVVVEGIVSYSNDSKERRLSVKESDLNSSGAVSSVVAYQMATGLLKTGKIDVAIATTGLAGPKTDDSGMPVGLCYIAVGTMEGVHTYKFNFSGDRESITETAKNSALFYALKNLKNV